MSPKSPKIQPWAPKVAAARFRADRSQLLGAPRHQFGLKSAQNYFKMCSKWSPEGLNIKSSRFSASFSEAILGTSLETVLETSLKGESSADQPTPERKRGYGGNAKRPQ